MQRATVFVDVAAIRIGVRQMQLAAERREELRRDRGGGANQGLDLVSGSDRHWRAVACCECPIVKPMSGPEKPDGDDRGNC